MLTDRELALDEEELTKRKQKAEDMSKLAGDQIAQATAKVTSGNLTGAIEQLLNAEKQTRQGGDVTSTSRICVAIITFCFEQKDYKLLNENLVLISKRRGQLKTAVQRTVQAAMEFIEKLEGATKLALIDTLIEITEGKIYVEVERARLTRILAAIKEKAGDIAGAAEVLRAVQVETFGAMDRNEKTDFILEQVRLCLADNDYIRAQILSNKINRKYLLGEEPAIQQLKLRFYQLLTKYYAHDSNFLEMARCAQSIYSTPITQSDEAARNTALKNWALYTVLAPHDSEQSDLLARVAADSNLADIQAYASLVGFFGAAELMRWPRVRELYAVELADVEGFATDGARWAVLHRRVVEHNIRVIAKYYERVHMTRVAQLLDLDLDNTEKYVSELVTGKSIYARIDRPSNIVTFTAPKSANDLLNDWTSSTEQLLRLVENITHLVAKERMQHGVDE